MLLYQGVKNKKNLIKRLQVLLNKAFNKTCCKPDGIFGPQTKKCVKKFQKLAGISVDGIVGSETIKKLEDYTKEKLFEYEIEKSKNLEIKLHSTPSYNELFTYFDDFRIPGWSKENLKLCDLSEFINKLQHIKLSWDHNISAFSHRNYFGFYCHKLVVDYFYLAFKEICDKNLHYKLNTYGGCFNIRYMRRSKKWSTHSWAIAIDLNPETNRFGQKNFDMDEKIVECFEKYGFVWGGRWKTPDAMHFQFCK